MKTFAVLLFAGAVAGWKRKLPGGYNGIAGGSSYNGLGITPVMGWNSWHPYGCENVNQSILIETAQAMVTLGLRDLGYHYVVLDDCWSTGRDRRGTFITDKTRFYDGMKWIADNIHHLGMKFGMYSSAGKFTCQKNPGSLGIEQWDADTFASWDIDYLKYDNCFNEGRSGTAKLSFKRYEKMSRALNKTRHDIVYSMCNWGQDQPWDWAQTIANSWRMSGDIYDSFNRPDPRCACEEEPPCEFPGHHCSVMNILNKMAHIGYRSMMGSFADMDMLEIGNGGQDDDEYVTQFSMWAMNSSPLIIGTDILELKAADLAILSNPAVIAINQDPSATAATRVWRTFVDETDEYGQGEISLWTRKLYNGDIVIALLNGSNRVRDLSAKARDIFLDQSADGGHSSTADDLKSTWDVYDLWANRLTDVEAQAIIDRVVQKPAERTLELNIDVKRYNIKGLSYEDGVRQNHPALFGLKVGELSPSGTWSAEVARHSVGLFRLRKQKFDSKKVYGCGWNDDFQYAAEMCSEESV